ncbi:MAG: dual specificity protein phosphatase family protein [Pirellulales bacterium]|nr:dual specificity protein phosphatase family protein [Pirellulales bacterium]
MNYNQISPDIYVGGCPCTPSDIECLQRETGVTAVLNVQTDEDFLSCGIDWAKMDAHYQKLEIAIRRVPVRDFDREDLRMRLPVCVEALDALLKQGGPVYVHCTAGVNRSPSVVISYLIWIRGWDFDRAVNHVMDRRLCDPYLEAIKLATRDR